MSQSDGLTYSVLTSKPTKTKSLVNMTLPSPIHERHVVSCHSIYDEILAANYNSSNEINVNYSFFYIFFFD